MLNGHAKTVAVLILGVLAITGMAARMNMAERTEDEVLVQSTSKFFRPAYAETPAIGAAYAGKYVCLVAVAVNTALSEAQMDQLETSITAITGVHNSFCLIGPARIPVDRTPTGYDLKIACEGKFGLSVTPEE